MGSKAKNCLAALAASACLLIVAPCAQAQSFLAREPASASTQFLPDAAEQLFALGNQARTANGLAPLKWDQSLAAGALAHCQRMTRGGAISHQYRDETDPAQRASAAGAHFSQIGENIATGPYASGIHQAWMNSPEHRRNLLGAGYDRVGIAVIARGTQLYAVADYARSAPVVTQAKTESGVQDMLRAKGLKLVADLGDARAYCNSTSKFHSTENDTPSFVIRWQNADPAGYPPDLLKRIASGRYHKAVVSSCPAQGDTAGFVSYRTAVLLYEGDSAAFASR